MTKKNEPKSQDCVGSAHGGVLTTLVPRKLSDLIELKQEKEDMDKTILPSSGASQLPVDRVKDCAKQDTVL
jgi:hypothetical protein